MSLPWQVGGGQWPLMERQYGMKNKAAIALKRNGALQQSNVKLIAALVLYRSILFEENTSRMNLANV